MTQPRSISHNEVVVRELREDPNFSLGYLRAAMEDTEEPKVLTIALRHLIDANGSVEKVADEARLRREELENVLLSCDDPPIAMLVAVLNALGFKLSVEPAK